MKNKYLKKHKIAMGLGAVISAILAKKAFTSLSNNNAYKKKILEAKETYDKMKKLHDDFEEKNGHSEEYYWNLIGEEELESTDKVDDSMKKDMKEMQKIEEKFMAICDDAAEIGKKVGKDEESVMTDVDKICGYLESVNDIEDDIEIIFSESVNDFINDDDVIDITESLADSVINLKTKIVVSAKLRKAIIKLALLNAKLKHLMKDTEKNKVRIASVKKDILNAEKEKRSLMKDLPDNGKSEVKKIEKKARSEANKNLKDIKESEEVEEANNTEEITTEVLEESKDDKYVERYQNQIDENEGLIKKYKENPTANQNKIKALQKENEDLKKKISYIKESSDDNKVIKDITDAFNEVDLQLNSLAEEAIRLSEDEEFKRFVKEATRNAIAAAQQAANDAQNIAITQSTMTAQQMMFLNSADDVIDDDVVFEKATSKVSARRFLTKQTRYLDSFKNKLMKVPGVTKKTVDSIGKFIDHQRKKLTRLFNSKTVTEAANMEDEIRPIVSTLNKKGYKVKYSSPGHIKLRKKEDKEPDGVYRGKLYSDARIMFDGKYKLPDAPKYWYFRNVDDCDYLDIEPITYNDKDGTPDEAFAKWKDSYMASLKDWVNNLKDASNSEGGKEIEANKEPKPTTESVDFYGTVNSVKECL